MSTTKDNCTCPKKWSYDGPCPWCTENISTILKDGDLMGIARHGILRVEVMAMAHELGIEHPSDLCMIYIV